MDERKRVAGSWYKEQAALLPKERTVPLVSFFSQGAPFIIGEFKKASPSAGTIVKGRTDRILPLYAQAKIKTFSVLTEENYFKGALEDLVHFKQQYPKCAFLRKDFLLEKRDIDISYRAGADCVLLIAAILTRAQLTTMISTAHALSLIHI